MPGRRELLVALFAALVLPVVVMAQRRPAGWQVRLDQGEHTDHGADSLVFVNMKAGFRVTTGPAGIMWHPDSVGRGDFTVEITLHLFDTQGRDREGYGLFVGGRDLAADGQSYTYFLLRNDGRFIIKQRQGAETSTLVEWTNHEAINRWSTASGASVKNLLAVKALGKDVQFVVNGKVVQTLLRAQVNPDGFFGVRANHGMNLQVDRITRTK